MTRYPASKPSSLVQLSVGLMLGGAIVAALRDLTFDMLGYFMILGNDFFTAAYGVAMKSVMSNGNVSKTSLMFYTSAFGAMVLWGLLFLQSAELNSVAEFEAPNPYFWMIYFTACIMGCVLNYSIFLCTSINSALTTVSC
jgi:solute carrier family 35 protein